MSLPSIWINTAAHGPLMGDLQFEDCARRPASPWVPHLLEPPRAAAHPEGPGPRALTFHAPLDKRRPRGGMRLPWLALSWARQEGQAPGAQLTEGHRGLGRRLLD